MHGRRRHSGRPADAHRSRARPDLRCAARQRHKGKGGGAHGCRQDGAYIRTYLYYYNLLMKLTIAAFVSAALSTVTQCEQSGSSMSFALARTFS